MKVTYWVWDSEGLSHGECDLTNKAFSTEIEDGDRRVLYDQETGNVLLYVGDEVVVDTSFPEVVVKA